MCIKLVALSVNRCQKVALSYIKFGDPASVFCCYAHATIEAIWSNPKSNKPPAIVQISVAIYDSILLEDQTFAVTRAKNIALTKKTEKLIEVAHLTNRHVLKVPWFEMIARRALIRRQHNARTYREQRGAHVSFHVLVIKWHYLDHALQSDHLHLKPQRTLFSSSWKKVLCTFAATWTFRSQWHKANWQLPRFSETPTRKGKVTRAAAHTARLFAICAEAVILNLAQVDHRWSTWNF